MRKLLLAAAVALLVTSCVAPDTRHRIVVSIPEQRLALLDNGALITTYPVSTSKFAIGDAPGSRGTPLGELEIAKKIGGGATSGTVFKDRRPTGEVLAPDAPGRDPIVSRILWLRGRETQNANLLRLRRIADEQIHFRRPLVAVVVFHKLLPVEIHPRKRSLHKLAHRVRLVRRQDEIVAGPFLHNPPHSLDVFGRVTPVAF